MVAVKREGLARIEENKRDRRLRAIHETRKEG